MAKTINQTYQDAYKTKKRRKAATVLGFILAVVGGIMAGIYYLFFLSGWLAVTNITVEQKSFIRNEEIREVVEDYLREKSWLVSKSSNLLMIDGGTIQSRLVRKFPVLKNVVVQKKYAHGLIIRAEHRQTAGIWCFSKQNKCLFFDNEGVAFDQALDSSGAVWLMVEDGMGESKELGQVVVEAEKLEWVFKLKKEMDRAKIGVAKVVIPEEWFRINIKTIEGWEAYFSTADPLLPQVRALLAFLANKVSLEQRNWLQYIDVRIPQRVYYKLIYGRSTN